jgi:hypothetical protein
MTTPKKIADLAGWVIEQNGDLSCPLLKAIGYWHEDLGTVARTIDILEDLAPGSHRRPIAEVRLATRLMAIAAQADAMLRSLGVEDPAALFAAEYERAAAKHPGMTLDADGHTDETRFYALAEEVGEVAASLTYDNTDSTGHNADTIAEVTQVGALALAWLARHQEGPQA